MITNFIYKLLNPLPLTKIKLFIAEILYHVIRLFTENDFSIVRRQGINYSLDIREGIDLSLYIFGHFQPHISNNRFITLPENAVIIDIGANIGSMSLSFAQLSQNTRVYAIEPTDDCFKKLLNNLALNPELKKRITACKLLFSDDCRSETDYRIFSSWRIDKKHKNSHPVHGGLKNSATSTPCLSLDVFCREKQIQRIDLIKIDTDGQELAILKGAKEILATQKPVIIFETGHYIMREHHIRFYDYHSLLTSYGYRLFSLQHKKEITLSNFRKIVPKRSTIDIIAITNQL